MELTPTMPLREAVEEFKSFCGGLLKIKGNPADTLKSLGLNATIKITPAMTAETLEKAAANAGLKVKVRTIDDWVAVIPEFPLGFISKIGKNSTKTKMADLLATLDVKTLGASAPTGKEEPAINRVEKKETKYVGNASEPTKQPKTMKQTGNNQGLITEEEMNEILKKLEALEARIAKIEKQLSSGAAPVAKASGKPSIVKMLPYVGIYNSVLFHTWYRWYAAKLNNGQRYRMDEIRTDEGNFTVGQTRKVADRLGYKYDSKTNREDLGWELVTKYGDGKYAFIGNKAVDAKGCTYDISEIDMLYDKQALRLATGELTDNEGKPMLHKHYTDAPMKLDPKWTEEEIAEKLVDYVKNIHRKS